MEPKPENEYGNGNHQRRIQNGYGMDTLRPTETDKHNGDIILWYVDRKTHMNKLSMGRQLPRTLGGDLAARMYVCNYTGVISVSI
jgi:hypothetical protein